jgi:hypothetical protein
MFAEDEPRAVSRFVSAAVALAYVVAGIRMGWAITGLRMFAFCLIPLGCIWFPEALGDYVGNNVTASSPPMLVYLLGWVILLLPVFALALIWIRT